VAVVVLAELRNSRVVLEELVVEEMVTRLLVAQEQSTQAVAVVAVALLGQVHLIMVALAVQES
jgi:hypothetical protein